MNIKKTLKHFQKLIGSEPRVRTAIQSSQIIQSIVLHVPVVQLNLYGDCPFCVAGTTVWNRLSVEIDKFSNCFATQVRNEVLAVRPTAVEEVQAVIKASRKLGLRVRAVGQGLSACPLYSDEHDVIIYVKDLKRSEGDQIEIIKDRYDHSKRYIVVGSAVTVYEFKTFQLEHDLCVPANVISGSAQIGGVVTTGCHGLGWNIQTLSDSVAHMRVINSDGDVVEYSMEKSRDRMYAAQCSLGLFGILVDVTFHVTPMVTVVTDVQWIKVDKLLRKKKMLQKVIKSNWSVEMSWFPFSGVTNWDALEAFMEGDVDVGDWTPKDDEVRLRIMNIPKKARNLVGEKIYSRLMLNEWLENKGIANDKSFITNKPQCAPCFLKAQAESYKSDYSGKVTQKLPDAIHYLSQKDDLPVHETEWTFSLDDDCTNLCTAIQGLLDLLEQEAKHGHFPVNMPVEMTFLKDSDTFLSPATCGSKTYGGSGHSCHVTVKTLMDTPHWRELSQKLADSLKSLTGARPHWYKEWADGCDDIFKEAYAKQIPKFVSELDASGADPDGVFLNDRLEKIFYPGGHPGRAKILEEHNNEEMKSDSSPTCEIL